MTVKPETFFLMFEIFERCFPAEHHCTSASNNSVPLGCDTTANVGAQSLDKQQMLLGSEQKPRYLNTTRLTSYTCLNRRFVISEVKVCTGPPLRKLLHPSIFLCFSGSRSQGQQFKQRCLGLSCLSTGIQRHSQAG